MSPSGGTVFEFGPFRLDVDEHVLWRSGAIVDLAPRPFEVLVLLLGRAGRLVRREDLTRQVWVDTFVTPATLSQNIWVLRRALGDAAGMIRTVPRLGYRFVGEVRHAAAPGNAR